MKIEYLLNYDDGKPTRQIWLNDDNDNSVLLAESTRGDIAALYRNAEARLKRLAQMAARRAEKAKP